MPQWDLALPMPRQGIANIDGWAARQDGARAANMETHKWRSYPGTRVIPAIWETRCQMGAAVLRLLRSQLAG